MPINFDAFPLRELRKGRSLAWDPHEIDLSAEAGHWKQLSGDERDLLLAQVVGFMVGERGVTHDLAPLQQTLRHEKGRMEEEMYLAQQLYEEAGHVEFFQRWMDSALDGVLGVEIPFPPGENNFFSDILPSAMQALNDDQTPTAQMRATVTYHQIVEGVLAETGYAILFDALDSQNVLPGLRKGLRLIQQDESRHIAFGTYLAQRLIREHSELEETFRSEMEALHDVTMAATRDLFVRFEETKPFGLEGGRYVDLSETLFQRRMRAVLRGGLVEA